MSVKRIALTEDLPALDTMWQAAFPEDTAARRALFFETVPLSHCLVLEQDGNPVSMVYSLPATVGGRRLQYIYAAATLPAYRGRGLFGELLRYSKEQACREGCIGSFLRPAEPSLVGYYARFGYRPWTFCERVRGAAGNGCPIDALSPQEYTARRQALLPQGALVWPSWFTCLAAQNDEAYAVGEATALCECAGETLIVKELLGDADVSALCAACGCMRYEWVRPASRGEVYTLYAPLSEELPPPYIGPVLD